MSIKIEAETELQLVCNTVDQSLVKKETPGCEVSKSDSIAHGYPFQIQPTLPTASNFEPSID
ncbi:hypothetical protein DAPPUDRAFT_315720 [Daphnia pulex]|uniref:Uncharacterized protein n=1 Tax=Daphnia pulex TaxID=6669 RepID=E9GAK5_DAPPU|nr:hypothetical protein DAPPUDRAFT_315713 [Daphnia pulex]EFX83267.1 hypothetical protein DAPPUDRAFT_315720 [Daphnia pulex]|eukprot:EFX83259.1 hypothetical protein DAPPUDRAFT_315713 [Daphnia pulex]